MNRNNYVYRMALAALLVAIGIIIPMFSPVKIPLGPAGSFTLASHVAIFLGMFLSPMIAVAVSIGTTIGFAMTFPFPVVMRAASHIIWAVVGALWLKKRPALLYHPVESTLFCVSIALLHATCEVLVVLPLFFSGQMADKGGLFFTLFVLVGGVTLLHSSVDYVLSVLVWRPLRHLNGVRAVSAVQ